MKKIMKRFKDNLASKRGMTLVEVLVAMSILMIIIFTFTPLFAQYYRNIRQSGELTRKTYEKASLIERLLSNRDSDNKGAYETYNVGVPLELYVKNSSNTTLKTLDFHTKANSNYVSKVEGNMVTTDGDKSNSGNEYTTIYLGATSQRLIAFPKALTDDFIEKEVMVVPIGFPEDFDITKFHVYYTDENGNWQTHELTKGEYYNVEDATDGDVPCAKFTFYGANEVVCFDNSPLVITYNSHQVEIEIIAPKIIMVGEKASDNNYYYYATSGVDTRTGRMDLIAKESANLTSAMNDVEWVDKGEGDNGKGGVNTYGYYIMGGDAGQVRRFWQKKDINTSSTSENYTWGGDTLYQYDRYYYITGNNSKDSKSYENIVETPNSTQAQFKSIFRSGQGEYTYNGVEAANRLSNSKITTLFSYKMITSNYYTANVTYDSSNKYEYYTTLGRVLAFNPRSGSNEYYAGNGSEVSDKNYNYNLYCWISGNGGYGSTLNANGYRTATNYEYQASNGYKNINGTAIDDDSLITITSVGAIQLNTSNSKYSKSTQNSIFNKQLYPEKSYTLYCGYIPAVIDTWGWKTANNVLGIFFNQNWSMWLHTGTLGIAFNGNSWYPVGKFGDRYSTSKTLSNSVFSNSSWKSLLNYYLGSELSNDTFMAPPADKTGLFNRDVNTYRYYGPVAGSSADHVYWMTSSSNHSEVSNYPKSRFAGIALPEQGNDYYITGGREVDITMGYLSQPYAISVQNPEIPTMSGLSGLTGGSDFYFKKYGVSNGGQFNHSFLSGGLRDNVTMLDIKSYHDELTGNNISLAVGYTLSYIISDYDYATRLGQVMNNGIVYIRATGNGTADDTEGSMESGKGWSLAKETNVFHQFFGIDQYEGVSNGGLLNKDGTRAVLGWNTVYHRNYFNFSTDSGKSPQPGYSPNIAKGNTNYGTNCHPLMDTECTTVNWGQTWDEKPQAMWGTANGTLLSWFYDYEEVQSGTYKNSKITGVRKEFESYMWADRYGSVVDNHYDYATGKVTGSGDKQKVTYDNTNGFISVLDSVNSVYFADSYWVAVGNCSMRNPATYCQSGKGNYSGSGEGTYINVKSTDENNTYKWTAVKVSTERINFVSVEYCEGIWYAMGYKDNGGSAGKNSDKAGNGMQDPGEEGVIFYATNPTIADLDSDPDYMSGGGYFDGSYTGGWRQAVTRTVNNKYTKETTVMKRQADSWKSFVFEGANSMASQG